jgi:hypothetical protein
MSHLGHSRHFDVLPMTSGSSPESGYILSWVGVRRGDPRCAQQVIHRNLWRLACPSFPGDPLANGHQITRDDLRRIDPGGG